MTGELGLAVMLNVTVAGEGTAKLSLFVNGEAYSDPPVVPVAPDVVTYARVVLDLP
ncbi:MAG: hypothetical protein R3B70_14050 [Polyangiaceae bacterium]